MKTIATQAFLPWLRQGIANTITAADGDPGVKTRATIDVALTLKGAAIGGGPELQQTISRNIALYGPGDIIGIESRAIVRTEPCAWTTNFESNYVPAIDFYDEDFPWRYTPAAPGAGGLHLRPWIALVVLTENEFTEAADPGARPLPCITVPDAGTLPPSQELWAWAHVHFNQGLSDDPDTPVTPDMMTVLPRVRSLIDANPDVAYSRLICPRRLADNTGYHAFVVPVFETGRLAGIGSDPALAPHATFPAWGAAYDGQPEAATLPFYYRWYFRTADHGDFEYLVRLLQAQPVDSRVGTRDMDVQEPGSNIPGIEDPKLGGILKLGGALRVPDADLDPAAHAQRQMYEAWDEPYPHPFQRALASFIDLADDYASQPAPAANGAAGLGPAVDDDPDPLITPPLYGCWHALTKRLLFDRDGSAAPNERNWVHKLNLDPRYRVTAAFGADVVETNAEEYMNDAWEQIGSVLEANARIRRLLLAREVAWRWHDKVIQPMAQAAPEKAFALMAPVATRVLASPVTIAHTQALSRVPKVYTSTAFRRVVRPRSRLMRRLPFSAAITPLNLLARVNSGAVSPAPPVVVPDALPTVDTAAGAALPPGLPAWLRDLLLAYPWLPLLALVLSIVLALLLLLVPVVGIVLALATLAGGVWLYRQLKRWQNAAAAWHSLGEASQTPAAVDALPSSPDFTLNAPGSSVRPTSGAADSPTAVRFKAALRDSSSLIVATREVSMRPPPLIFDLAGMTGKLAEAIDPQVVIPARARSLVGIPDWIREQLGDRFGEVMAYPKIDLPMYRQLGTEQLLPNINVIPNNSITLIETNQPFIESYMVGLNHEFARKLLWREYPTDQRGSYFRQFWDTRGCRNTDNLPPDKFRESIYDIPKLHQWAPESALGEHNNRVPPDRQGADAVLVIRGELLKRYPTAVIYAHHAQWTFTEDGSIDLLQPRTLQDIDAAFEENPPPSIVRTPLYEAKAEPDIYFFGFDLSVAEAKGGPGTHPSDDAGWFFVIQERPGEPRFGLELERTGALSVFDELTWDDAVPSAKPGAFLAADSLSSVGLVPPPASDPEGKQQQYDEDRQVNAADISAARWAYLLFRQPVMVAVHADEMLNVKGAP